jgi:hypothetical protein
MAYQAMLLWLLLAPDIAGFFTEPTLTDPQQIFSSNERN